MLDSGTAHDARDPSLVFTTEGEEKYCEKVCLKHTNWSQRQPLLAKLQNKCLVYMLLSTSEINWTFALRKLQ